MRRLILPAVLAGVILALTILLLSSPARSVDLPAPLPAEGNATTPTDGWIYSRPPIEILEMGRVPMASPAMAKASLGMAVGGAKDVANFRENIAGNFLPLPTDVTYEGLFYDYYFDTGQAEPCTKLFCPSAAQAVSRDPFNNAEEYYLAVGLNSGMAAEDFSRKALNLMVVLDNSASMGAPFDRYYYDAPQGQKGRGPLDEPLQEGSSKMALATRAVATLLNHLKPGDRFGMVIFDSRATLARPLLPVQEEEMAQLKAHIQEIAPMGGTNLSAGMELGTRLFDALGKTDPNTTENRIIFCTDAMPNLGNTDDGLMLQAIADNAKAGINTTFVGIGVDLNTELVEAVTKARGANYYSVHSAEDFTRRMDKEFDFMVTPLVYDLRLTLQSTDFAIERVLGSPEANLATGEVMRVNTLFPSAADERGVRGGLILLKLRRTARDGGNAIALTAAYEDRAGRKEKEELSLVFGQGRSGEFSDTSGLRKGILLARYAGLLRSWAAAERTAPQVRKPATLKSGIPLPTDEQLRLGRWERQSMPLKVSAAYHLLFDRFAAHFDTEAAALSDPDLQREAKVLDRLATFTD